jgi:hypothetical protein
VGPFCIWIPPSLLPSLQTSPPSCCTQYISDLGLDSFTASFESAARGAEHRLREVRGMGRLERWMRREWIGDEDGQRDDPYTPLPTRQPVKRRCPPHPQLSSCLRIMTGGKKSTSGKEKNSQQRLEEMERRRQMVHLLQEAHLCDRSELPHSPEPGRTNEERRRTVGKQAREVERERGR